MWRLKRSCPDSINIASFRLCEENALYTLRVVGFIVFIIVFHSLQAEEGPYWERLLQDKTKAHWLKVNPSTKARELEKGEKI